MRIVFMGTPDFAACSLQKLIEQQYEIVGVFTQPDKPSGRGMSLRFSPVKQLALEHGLPVFQPETLRGEEPLALLRSLQPDVCVVVAYGKLLPDALLAVAPLGCINVHGSLLPKYRGSAPIQWAVLNGDEKSGVSTMYLSHDMDAGDVIFTAETEIGEFETSGALFDRLMVLGAQLLDKTLCAIEAGTAPRTPQDPAAATYTKQLEKSDCPIQWNRPPRMVVKQICGLQPWPVATTELAGETVRVFAAEYTETRTDKPAGSIVSAGKAGIEFACAGGETLRITELQPAGKRRMKAADYLLGHPTTVD